MNPQNVIGAGFTDKTLSPEEIQAILAQTFSQHDLRGQRVLVLIPDTTRTIPMDLFFHGICDELLGKAAALDFLVALGTHQPLSEEAMLKHVGISAEERTGKYAGVGLFNHHWEREETFAELGVITRAETLEISSGMLGLDVPVRVNRLVLDYDVVIVMGPVFPHEVAGFSGGDKYFFPGISGPEVINFTHWLGALITSYHIIGAARTPVRAVIERAAALIPTPKLYLCAVTKSEGVYGLYAGRDDSAWNAAAALSAQLHVRYVEQPYQTVVSVLPRMYDDLWTGAKGMYKMEPVISDGGEVIIYAPHLTEISYTHGKVIDQIGYHVRDYFVKQWDKFADYPWGVLAHSTHLRGIGTYENGIERPRITVTLATGIPRERTERVNLSYRSPEEFDLSQWTGREDEGILVVPHAGETLYRLKTPEAVHAG
jgi:nickel-dependent lactate racemase